MLCSAASTSSVRQIVAPPSVALSTVDTLDPCPNRRPRRICKTWCSAITQRSSDREKATTVATSPISAKKLSHSYQGCNVQLPTKMA